jgi:probable HAF family extracellular repeat protein
MTDLGTLGGQHSSAYGINDAGQVVGFSSTPTGVCTYPDGTVQPADHAVLWENGGIRDLDQATGCSLTYAFAITNAGQIIGGRDICYSAFDCYRPPRSSMLPVS